jgi:hypothetical protein
MSYYGIKHAPRPKWSSSDKRSIIDHHPSCVYCGSDDYWDLVVDHIYPIAKGGCSEPYNLTVACDRCNSHKWAYDIEDFFDVTCEKRKKSRIEAIKIIKWLRSYRNGRPIHYMHCESSLIRRLQNARNLHSYFTKIIRSIMKSKYQIFQ